MELKQRQKQEADHIEETQRLVTEIEMLKVVSVYQITINEINKTTTSSFFVDTFVDKQ